MNEYEYRIPLFGPNYSNSRIIRIIRDNTATDPPGKLDVLWHDGDPLGVDGAQVGVLKQTNKVGLAGT